MENTISVRSDQAIVVKSTSEGTVYEIANRSELAIFKSVKGGCRGEFSANSGDLRCSGECGVSGESCSMHTGYDSEGNWIKWCMCGDD